MFNVRFACVPVANFSFPACAPTGERNPFTRSGLDICYVPAGPRAFFRLSGQFGPQQFMFCWPAGPMTFISVVNTFTIFSVDLSRARGFLIRNLPSPS